MFRRLLESPDPYDPELEQRLTGEALNALRSNLRTLREANQALRFGPQYTFEALSIDIHGDEAVVRECVVDDGDVVDGDTGEVVEPAPVVTVLNEVTLLRGSGGWRSSRTQQVDGWEGIAGCAK